jgi:phosphate transport system protein
MLRDALDAFVSRDVARAEEVVRADGAIDTWMHDAFDVLVAEMQRDPATIRRAIATIFFGKHIERMADHATNIAEMVVYQVRGQDVRHPSGR